MQKRSIIIITSIVTLSLLVVVMLYAIADEPFSYQQNFTRTLRNNFVKQQHTVTFDSSGYYLAGVTDAHLYIGSQTNPLIILVTDSAMRSHDMVRLSITGEDVVSLKGARVEIDSPFFYIKAGAMPAIFKGVIGQWRATRILDNITFFEQAVPLGAGSFAYQSEGGTASHKTRINLLCKAAPYTNVLIKGDILEGQVDNYYSTLGTLRYSKTLHQLIYTYAYRDEYIVMDTSLNVLHKANSIGTVREAHIKPIEVGEGVYTLASTSAIVNRGTQVYNNLLFINSNLIARNENREVVNSDSVLDVYDLTTNQYMFSFYLPDYNGIKLTSFKIKRHGIVAMYDRYVITYTFNEDIFIENELGT